jgi:hypothetical protein
MIFRLQVTLQDGKRYAGLGYFADTGEALEQTWADYPEASAVSAICLNRRAAP